MSGSQHIEHSSSPFDLRRERINKGLSIRQLAAQIKIAPETYRKLEDGEPVHPATALKVAEFYGVEAAELVLAPAESGSRAA
jgi:transcriptional regulator with XRE-family HTH domain